MREAWLLLALALGAIVFAGYVSTRVRRILLLGDSLAVGVAGPLEKHAVAKHITFAAEAKESTRAEDWQGEVETLLRHHKPDLLLISLGTNDCVNKWSQACAKFPAAAAAIVRAAKRQRVRLAWLVPLWLDGGDPDGHANRIWERLPDGTCRIGVPHRPFPKLQPDGIHPTPEGYRTWAADIARELL